MQYIYIERRQKTNKTTKQTKQTKQKKQTKQNKQNKQKQKQKQTKQNKQIMAAFANLLAQNAVNEGKLTEAEHYLDKVRQQLDVEAKNANLEFVLKLLR